MQLGESVPTGLPPSVSSLCLPLFCMDFISTPVASLGGGTAPGLPYPSLMSLEKKRPLSPLFSLSESQERILAQLGSMCMSFGPVILAREVGCCD